ncbi:hypothetical protein DAEQUDRAFT_760767 [Daedalea quercina L-15889]|uniref:LIM zinc-binding domain-containing protein n=1 Tax=Daedalea quercina L-15889 TaxID=1314783 RepID=A0A165UD95_9APHY|nr:hypothetical protein DAEQUDRAFT_760767 [Daedalea quercina L-15889]
MGFCRRCGDIVVGPRCKCGGTAVAPVVKWEQNGGKPQDKWSRIYVTREKSPTRPVRETVDDTPPLTSTTSSKRFPRPTSSITLGTRVSAHIVNATAPRPPSPLKHSSSIGSADSPPSTSAAAAAGILPNPNGSELAKVYGSVLQPKETLDSYHCALCSTPFPPDATIYPDPSTLSSTGVALTPGNNIRFLCRPCFTDNGGSKGDCAACYRPVLILKTEGGLVENGSRVWHKKCFLCNGCGKDIGDAPMVDLLGKPCCADCFDTCLARSNRKTPQKPGRNDDTPLSNLGGTRRGKLEREGSPALEELEQRLGIVRSRENTPVNDERPTRSSVGLKNPTTTPVRSPLASRYTPGNGGSVDNSPIAERLAARVRADSFPSIGSSPALQSNASARTFNRLKTPGPEILDGDGSPLSARRISRYRSPEPDDTFSDGSPATRRTYNRFRSSEPDVFGSSPISRATGSPRYGSPSAAPRQPTEEAIEKMKRRFLGQASPAPATSLTPPGSTSAETMTARRRSRSRARSSAVDESGVLRPSLTGTSTGGGQETPPRIPRKSGTPSLRNSPSVGPLQTSVRQNRTGETDYTLRRDRTGDDEVESLLGEKVPTGNLIDLGTETQESEVDLTRSESTGPMSDIPTVLSASRSSVSMGLGAVKGLGIRTATSRTDLNMAYDQSIPSTPDLASEFSDTTSTTQSSSAPSTPPSLSPPSRRTSGYGPNTKPDITPLKPQITSVSTTTGSGSRRSRASDVHTPTPKSKTLPNGVDLPSPTPFSPDARCAKCNLPLFTTKHGGKFVTVPEEPSSSGVPPKTYHTACFKCKVCDGPFEEHEGGRAVFVRGEDGACHVECAPPEKVKVHKFSSSIPKLPISTMVTTPLSTSRAHNTSSYSTREPTSSRYERPPPSAPATSTTFTFPKFGGGVSCPGCNVSVSPMERGVVSGPQGSRWHTNCLLCGGKGAKGRRKEEGKPGCGKKLDSAAKTDNDGRVWCRECLLLLPASMRTSSSPVRSPVMPSHTGNRSVVPQYTGTTTIARQFTGLGGLDAALMRQLTGGGLSPTRQLSSSPTKLHDGPRPGARYPRPKSVTGIRSTKSDGEGRGMFLVRQLTGGR